MDHWLTGSCNHVTVVQAPADCDSETQGSCDTFCTDLISMPSSHVKAQTQMHVQMLGLLQFLHAKPGMILTVIVMEYCDRWAP